MSPSILAIDPGTEKSGVIFWHDGIVNGGRAKEVVDNWELLRRIRDGEYPSSHFAIEQICSYGMAVGKETFKTVEWSGRFIEAWAMNTSSALDYYIKQEIEPHILRLPRLDIKVHLCGTAKAKDANIRQALIDRLGEPGTKKNPGPTFGISSHMWSALAVAAVAADRIAGKERGQS